MYRNKKSGRLALAIFLFSLISTSSARADYFDVFNHTNFNNPGGNTAVTNNSSFGKITGTLAQSERIGQLSLKLRF